MSAIFVHAFMLGAGPFDNCMFIICIAFILGADHTSYAGCVLNGCCGARLHAHSRCVVGATRFEHGLVVVALVVAIVIVSSVAIAVEVVAVEVVVVV